MWLPYADLTLQPGEKVVRVARLHWIIYRWALLYLLLAAVAASMVYVTIGFGRFGIMIISALVVMAARYALQAWWRQIMTEIAVTNRRVIRKTGFIWRHTDEMFVASIESVFVDQSILGRILNFGSIHCRGNGEGMEHLHYVADPIAVQTAINRG